MLPCAAQLNGEYGIKDIYAGVPIIIGKSGVEKIEEINLEVESAGCDSTVDSESASRYQAFRNSLP